MAVPIFLNSAFRYREDLAVVDVNTIISRLDTELTSLPDPWTRPGATGPWTSPARSDGSFIKITASRISATRIAWVVTDQNGVQVNNATDTRQDIDALGTTIHYYTGPFHAVVSSERATPECWGAGMMDQTPESFSVPRPACWASGGPRNNAGTLNSQPYTTIWLFFVAGTAYTLQACGTPVSPVGTGTPSYTSMSGALLFAPSEYHDTAGFHFGRMFQALLIDSAQSFSAEFTVPIDTSTTGVFKISGFATGASQNITCRLAFRKA